MMSEHWPRGTLVTRLYERDSLALSLIRSSGETRAHRSPSARPALLTVRRLLYSNDSFHSFSSAEFCSAYQTLTPPAYRISTPTLKNRHPPCAGVSTGVHGSKTTTIDSEKFAPKQPSDRDDRSNHRPHKAVRRQSEKRAPHPSAAETGTALAKAFHPRS